MAVVTAVVAIFGSLPAQAVEPQIFRISTENTTDHVQTRAVARFASELQRRAGARLTVSHHPEAELFRDADVVKALRLGKIEMGVPGTWQLDRSEPSVGIFLLPTFYGRDIPNLDRLRDGEIGREINRRIEDNLGLHVAGRWIDLGFTHIFGVNRTISSYQDLAGMRIRIAGGEANLKRIEGLGAEPRVIPWPNLQRALSEGSVDGILTTYETVASAKLWEHGITSVFEDQQYFAQYVPLIAGSTWKRLSPELRVIIAEVWEQSVAGARAEATKAQVDARVELTARGFAMTRPPPDQLVARRARLMETQSRMLMALGIDEMLAAKAMAQLGSVP